MVNFAINGFGRIGRTILRAFLNGTHTSLKPVVVNVGMGDIRTALHLFKYDSLHGAFEDVSLIDESTALIKGHKIEFIFQTDPKNIDWHQYKIDVVMECTGKFTKKQLAYQHIYSGAKKVLVSAPCDDADITVVLGVNNDKINEEHEVISVGSCTTNCLAPIVKILNDTLGIEQGFMTTVHAYTSDQNLVDGHHKDLRRARAAALSMIPSSTGAAKAIGLVIPELAGKLDGVAVRVPVPNVSMIDLCFNSFRSATVEQINKMMHDARGKVISYVNEELVSVDFLGNPASAIFDATQTKVVGGKLCRVVAWYDNEYGFSNRMLDVAKIVGGMV